MESNAKEIQRVSKTRNDPRVQNSAHDVLEFWSAQPASQLGESTVVSQIRKEMKRATKVDFGTP